MRTIEPTELVLFIFEVEGSADQIQHFLRHPQRQLEMAVAGIAGSKIDDGPEDEAEEEADAEPSKIE